MAVDKLVDSTQLDSDLTSVANAIRTKGGTSASLAFPNGFVSAIGDIPSGGGSAEAEAIIKSIRYLGDNGLKEAPLPEKCFFQVLTNGGTHFLQGITGAKIIVLPVITTFGNYPITDNTAVETLDIGGTFNGNIGNYFFSESTHLKKLILRRTTIHSLSNVNAFNLTQFASGGTGGTLYVPSSLISSYQSASNWSTIIGYANNSIVAIEGSAYENYYADGTPIT